MWENSMEEMRLSGVNDLLSHLSCLKSIFSPLKK